LIIWRSRSVSARSASSIVFNVSASSGSVLAASVTRRVNHSRPGRAISFVTDYGNVFC
jgi:hypothetical protein